MAQEENAATKETNVETAKTNTDETEKDAAVTTTNTTEKDETKNENNKENNDDSNEKTEEKQESIYNTPMAARIEVGNGFRYNRPLNFYVDRARRILRTEKTLEVTGHGTRVSKACTLVEVLKRQKIASIKSVSTGMEIIPYFTKQGRGGRGGDAMWSQPTTVIRFTLEQAEFASYVSDYHQRKVIEIFENTDENNSGSLDFSQIEKLDLANAFYANEEQIEESKKFLTENGGSDKSLNLPNFIKYSSILIHPLLKDDLFKQALTDKFGIVTGDQKGKDNDDEDEEPTDE